MEKAIPVIISTEVTIVREDEWGEEHTLSVEVSGAVWETDGEISVLLKGATDDAGGRFVASVDDMGWGERSWCEDSLAAAWEDLHA